ncbi:hypothetical protein [Nostoc sp. MG11]|uniref:hypothetical protein n=1 Tax=Nostoc sp. MG11 TaxID=2721166 RepID=UPI0018686C56|nr:hypothetical protein [Nostoc sp. MG11]
MTDFLTRLAARTLELMPMVQPQIAPIYAVGDGEWGMGKSYETEDSEQSAAIERTEQRQNPALAIARLPRLTTQPTSNPIGELHLLEVSQDISRAMVQEELSAPLQPEDVRQSLHPPEVSAPIALSTPDKDAISPSSIYPAVPLPGPGRSPEPLSSPQLLEKPLIPAVSAKVSQPQVPVLSPPQLLEQVIPAASAKASQPQVPVLSPPHLLGQVIPAASAKASQPQVPVLSAPPSSELVTPEMNRLVQLRQARVTNGEADEAIAQPVELPVAQLNFSLEDSTALVQPVQSAGLKQLQEAAGSQPTMAWSDRRIDAAPSVPTIHISIGRIEVRAVSPPAPTRSRSAPAAPRLSLEDYLKSKGG